MSQNKIYVGNLSYTTSEQALEEMFGQAGDVVSVKMIKDRDTGRSKGFAFVEMETEEGLEKAIESFDGQDLDGRNIKVSKARPMERNGQGGGGGRGGFGGGGGGFGGGRSRGGSGGGGGGRGRY